jgi:FkbM family methyltransferase
MLNNLLLAYMRHFPIDYGKSFFRRFIKVPDGNIIYKTRYNAKFRLYLDEYQMKEIYCYNLYEKNTITNLVKLLKPNFTFIDVGANAGFYSVIVSKHLHAGKVYSFEPSSFIIERLKENVALNNCSNIIINQLGLSDKEEVLNLSFTGNNTGGATVYKKAGSTEYSEKINLIPFDDYYSLNRIGKIDVIKVDIEGGELGFLKGAEKAIAENFRLIVVLEMMDEHFRAAGYSAGHLFDYMRNLGFTAYLPKPFPFGMVKVKGMPKNHFDNIIFLRGY